LQCNPAALSSVHYVDLIPLVKDLELLWIFCILVLRKQGGG
jgi:hypothetical protein